jgi:hypothetical protein
MNEESAIERLQKIIKEKITKNERMLKLEREIYAKKVNERPPKKIIIGEISKKTNV